MGATVLSDMEVPMDMHRRAKIFLTPHELSLLLGLPHDVRIVGVESRLDPAGLSVLVESSRLPAVPTDSEAPTARVRVTTVTMTGSDGIDWPAEPSGGA